MAPKGGKGGGTGGLGGISSSCPGAFQYDSRELAQSRAAYFAEYCVFFLVALFILIAMRRVKKRHGNAKRLLGPIYLVSLLFALLGNALLIVATMLQECRTTDFRSFYQWAIAFLLFFRLSNFLLLVLVVYNVNDLLRQLHGHNPSYFKFIYGFILAIMGALTCGLVGIQCYNASVSAYVSSGPSLGDAEIRLRLAYYVLYLVSILAAGALAAATVVSMRARGTPRGNLTGWTIALMFSMFLWTLFTVIEYASNFTDQGFDYKVYLAFSWIENTSQAFSWICMLFIAKSTVLAGVAVNHGTSQIYNNQTPTYPPTLQQQSQPAYAPVPVPQQQQYQQQQQNHLPYTFHTGAPPPPPQQQYYYQQQPVYNGTPNPMNGNGHMVELK
ncbi:hypothetical protein K505DRAFT_359177 [Melanomma pulvis-pyrius CBS 109.77]|uniref:Uncharacterized protein n=1 Tax=Melanomma pulvis-pyrius CBS 109.77 TaxID=1314802 RepID=A0A6A6XJ96_9PLEO|nr:hypothetical protein K505DRAFT_359177 [Melanomma pulvis-pyrius CBS 109.77]